MAPCGIGKKFIAELLGTFFLVFFGTGSAVITLMISESVNPNNVGIGILGGLGDWIAIALAFGLTVMVCIYLFGRISALLPQLRHSQSLLHIMQITPSLVS